MMMYRYGTVPVCIPYHNHKYYKRLSKIMMITIHGPFGEGSIAELCHSVYGSPDPCITLSLKGAYPDVLSIQCNGSGEHVFIFKLHHTEHPPRTPSLVDCIITSRTTSVHCAYEDADDAMDAAIEYIFSRENHSLPVPLLWILFDPSIMKIVNEQDVRILMERIGPGSPCIPNTQDVNAVIRSCLPRETRCSIKFGAKQLLHETFIPCPWNTNWDQQTLPQHLIHYIIRDLDIRYRIYCASFAFTNEN